MVFQIDADSIAPSPNQIEFQAQASNERPRIENAPYLIQRLLVLSQNNFEDFSLSLDLVL